MWFIESSQRKKLKHSVSKSLGSGAKFLINFLIWQLNLPIELHPKAYMISRIKNVQPVKVVEKCLVPFSIGKYYTNSVIDKV